MARVLLVGIDPALVDYSDPALPPGLDAETVSRGIASALDGLREAGHEPAYCSIPPDPNELAPLAEQLAGGTFDCVAIGGGVRLPPRHLALFEAVLNTIARAPRPPAIALAPRPDETPAAVTRALAWQSGTAG